MAITPRFFLLRPAGPALQTAVARGVQGHLHAIQVVPLNRLGQDLSIGMAGHADGARHLLLARFQQPLECTVGRLDPRQVSAWRRL